MKSKLFAALVFLSFISVCDAQTTGTLVGTWKMVSGTIRIGDSTMQNDMTKSEAMKIVTPTHFAVFSKNLVTGDIEHAGAGPVQVDAANYTETIMYATGTGNKYPMMARFTYELNGDRWHIKGGFDKYIFDEVWQRVK